MSSIKEALEEGVPDEFVIPVRHQFGKLLATTAASFIATQAAGKIYDYWLIRKHIKSHTQD